MAKDHPVQELKEIAPTFYQNRKQVSGKKRYIPYDFAQGLRKMMNQIEPEDVQEITATRSFNAKRNTLDVASNTLAEPIFNGEEVTRKQFELKFDKATDGNFPWIDIKSALDNRATIYDLPIREIIIQFDDEDFTDIWRNQIESAIEVKDLPLNWIEPPFFAVLNSSDPGDSDARKNVKNHHEEFYYKPKFQVDEDYDGMDWSVKTLDLQAIWSYQAFSDKPQPIITARKGGKKYDWTPRRIERYIMNYFNPEEKYSGVLRDNKFATEWRRAFSLNTTSIKTFEWEEDEEWVLAGA